MTSQNTLCCLIQMRKDNYLFHFIKTCILVYVLSLSVRVARVLKHYITLHYITLHYFLIYLYYITLPSYFATCTVCVYIYDTCAHGWVEVLCPLCLHLSAVILCIRRVSCNVHQLMLSMQKHCTCSFVHSIIILTIY